ncbi:hypothetical protein CFP56_009229 [Quercus suber]|uniref:Uncharacterized protein n=1 Tax=Quercus suber TaxID=58331 RepID=A0AAW0L4T4_QUESU
MNASGSIKAEGTRGKEVKRAPQIDYLGVKSSRHTFWWNHYSNECAKIEHHDFYMRKPAPTYKLIYFEAWQ